MAIITPLAAAPTIMAKSAKYTVLKVSKLNTSSKTVTGTATKSAKITVKHGSKTLGTSKVSNKGKYSVKVSKLGSWSLKVSASKKKYRTKTVTIKVASLPKTIKNASMIVYYNDPSNKLLATSKQTLKLNSKFKAPKKNISCYTASKSKYSGFTLKSSKITKLTKKPTYTITYKYAKNVLTPANKKILKSKVSKFHNALQSTKNSDFYKSNSSKTISAYNNAVTNLNTYVAPYLKITTSPSKISSSFINNETKLLNTCQTAQSAYNSAKGAYDKLHTLTISDKQTLNKQITTINNKLNSAKSDDFYKTGNDKIIRAYSDAVTKLNQFVTPYSLTQLSTSYIDTSFNSDLQNLIAKVQTAQSNFSTAENTFNLEEPYRNAIDGAIRENVNFYDSDFNKAGTTGAFASVKINNNYENMVFHNGQTYQQVILNGVRGYIIYSDAYCVYAIKPNTTTVHDSWVSTFSPADCGNPTNFDNGATWYQINTKTKQNAYWNFNSDTNTWTAQ